MGRLVLDLRFAARMFARQPTLAAAAVATLALGIGANSGPADPATYAGVALLLTLAAMLSAWIPGRRATRLDPMAALRSD